MKNLPKFQPSLETFRRYFEILQGQRDCLLVAVRERRYEEIAAIAHKLEGSGGLYGFDLLSELATLLFQAGEAKNEKETQHLTTLVNETINQILIHKA